MITKDVKADNLRRLEQDWPAPKIDLPPILREQQTQVFCIPINQIDEEKIQ